MSEGMLGVLPLSEIRGPRDAFEEKLAGSEGSMWLEAFKRFLRKENPWPVRRLIDGDALPYILNNWKIEEHRKGGQLDFDPRKVKFHLDDTQKTGTIGGHELRKKLVGLPVMNACVLDHLLDNTNLIPDEWKVDEQGQTRFIYFWGTIYRDSGGNLYVRFLFLDDGYWNWHYSWLDDGFDDQDPAAILAS